MRQLTIILLPTSLSLVNSGDSLPLPTFFHPFKLKSFQEASINTEMYNLLAFSALFIGAV